MKPYLFGLIAIVWMGSAAVAQRFPSTPSAEMPPAGGGIDLAGIDRSIAPGDNFYDFANAGWTRATPIPENRRTIGTVEALTSLSNLRTRDILEHAAADPTSKIGIAYSTFLDRKTIDAKGMAPIAPWLDKLRGLTRETYPAILAAASNAEIGGPFATFVAPDTQRPTEKVLFLTQAGLGLPDRDYYVEGGRYAQLQGAYHAHLVRLLTLAGETDAEARAAAVVTFESAIARVSWPRAQRRDIARTHNRMPRAALARLAPGFDFAAFWSALGIRDGDVIVMEPSAITGIARLIGDTPVAVLRDQLLLRSLDQYADMLPTAYGEEKFSFTGTTLSGATAPIPRWQAAIDFTTGALQDDVSKLYVARYFPAANRARIGGVLANVTAAVDARLAGLAWMSPRTRTLARSRLAAVSVQLGYPPQWRDYSSLRIVAGDAFGNAWRANEWNRRDELAHLGQPATDGSWGLSPMTVNAYTNFSSRQVVVTAALLQPPVFDPAADPAVLYGTTGVVIAGQLALNFDAVAARLDAVEGSDWWSAADYGAYDRLSTALAAQYSTYQPLPGVTLNGPMVVNEAASDLAGLTAAYDAYHLSLGGKPAPVIDGLTGDQRFFLAFAQMWRRSYRDAALRQRVATDPHAPSVQRVAIVRNLDAWYAAFDVRPGQKLYLPPDQRVRIW